MKRGWAVLCLAVAGCSTESAPEILTTDGLATAALVFAVTAQGNGDAVLVSASITAADGSARVLADGESLVVSAADAPKHALSAYGQSGYLGFLPTRGSQITITLVRAAEQASADVDLPAPFTLTVPSGMVSAISTIPLSWEASDMGDAMTLSVSGSCVTFVSRNLVSDTGSYVLQPGDLAISGAGCELGVALSRARSGAALGLGASNSSATATQVRTAAIEVSP